MRILLVHNRYIQRAGEDIVFDRESAMLRQYGHETIEFVKDNRHIGAQSNLSLATNAIWSSKSKADLKATISQANPDLVHFHNTQPLISPSAYYAAGSAGVPIVQTLHNFRPLCLPGLFLRKGKVCEDCLGSMFYGPGVLHACYRDDRRASATVAASLAFHRLIGTWSRKVTRYIALTNFARKKFIQGGLPADRISVKPNFTFDRTDSEKNGRKVGRHGAIFVGRLSPEKGVITLIEAWSEILTPLRILGDGPLLKYLSADAPSAVTIMGQQSPVEVAQAMSQARYLVMPSECFEGFSLVLVEAFSAGLPVIASRLGAMSEIVDDGQTGLHFTPGDANDLGEKILWADQHPIEMQKMGANARRKFEEKYTPEKNYQQLVAIYKDVITHHRKTANRSLSNVS